MLTSLFSLFYVTGECHRFLHRGWAEKQQLKNSGWKKSASSDQEPSTKAQKTLNIEMDLTLDKQSSIKKSKQANMIFSFISIY